MPFIGENLLRPRMFLLQAYVVPKFIGMFKTVNYVKVLWVFLGGSIAQWLAHLLPAIAAPGSIAYVSDFFQRNKL